MDIQGTPGNDALSGGAEPDLINGLAGNDTLNGLGGIDTLNGGDGDDVLDGGAGNDVIDGGGQTGATGALGDLLMFTGATAGVVVDLLAGTATDGQGGTDKVSGIESVQDTAFADNLKGDAFNANGFLLGAGDDTVDGGAGTGDFVSYQTATGAIVADFSKGTITGSSIGTDRIVNIEGLRASPFNDQIIAGATSLTMGDLAGDDTVTGSPMDDIFAAGSGKDSYNGGGGFDTLGFNRNDLDFSSKALSGKGVTVDLKAGTAVDQWGDADTLVSIEFITGSAFADTLTGGNTANDLVEGFTGGAGDDTIDGGTGFDRAQYFTATVGISVTLNEDGTGTAQDGQGGTDTLRNIDEIRGGGFGDTLTGTGTQTNSFQSFSGEGGNDTLNGGAGTDRANYQFDPAAVTVDLAAGTAKDGRGGTDTLISIEEVRGSNFADTITGDANANFLDGGAGDDTLNGGDGADWALYTFAPAAVVVNLATGKASGGVGADTLVSIENVRGSGFADTLTGDAGDNVLEGRLGNDTLDGGAGSDTARYENAPAAVVVNLAAGTAAGGDGTDTLISIENARGSNFGDTLTGDAAANLLRPLGGNDTVDGGAGIDTVLFAGARAVYTVARGTGTVTVTSGEGVDVLSNVERWSFTDANVAWDLDGSAGNAAKLIGALVGGAAVQNRGTVSAALGAADAAGTQQALCDLAVSGGLTATLAGGADNASLARLLLRNLLGGDPAAALVTQVAGLVDSGAFTQASLLVAACNLDQNLTNVNLVGLTQNGLVY